MSIVNPSGFREWARAGQLPGSGADAVLVFSGEDQVFRYLGGGVTARPVSLFQVVPLEREIGTAHFESWRSSLPGTARKGGAFVLDNGLIRGTGEFGGIRVGPVSLPEEWPRNPLLVVDAGFFLPLYKDEVRTPMVPLVMKLVATLHNASVRWNTARIIDRNGSPDFPLEFGYLPELLREVLADPEAFRDRLPERWERLDRAQYLAFFGQEEEALREYSALAASGGHPAVQYQAARLSFRAEGGFRDGIRYLEEAARRDGSYSRGFLALGAFFWDREDLEATERILRAGRSLFPEDPMMAAGLARVLAEQAVRLRGSDPESAERRVREALSLPVPEEIRGEILEGWGESPMIPFAPADPSGKAGVRPVPER